MIAFSLPCSWAIFGDAFGNLSPEVPDCNSIYRVFETSGDIEKYFR